MTRIFDSMQACQSLAKGSHDPDHATPDSYHT